MKPRHAYAAGAVLLVCLAAFLPTGWYDTIPRKPGMVLPFSGASLLRLTFLIEAVVLVVLTLKDMRFRALPAAYGAVVPQRKEVAFDISRTTALIALAVITAIAVLLRVHNLNQDLWLDEISPLLDYMRLTPAQIMGSYLRSNNHLLNTLLERISTGAFGEHEWSARLPAVVLGTLTVPALYWVARVALSRIASLGAALVLAASYHHVFFSQNARGYTSYMLFALLSTALLIRALQHDSFGRWALYVAAVVLGSASLLITAFVIAAHGILCAIVAMRLRNAGLPVMPLVLRLIPVLAIAGFLAFQIYAAALPEVYVVINTVYAEPGTGYPPFSAEFFGEMVRGISAGFGGPLIAAAFLIFGAMGYWALLGLSWPLAIGLTLPPVLTAVALGARGLTFSPRFFLLLLPLAILAAMSGVQWLAQRFGSRALIVAAGIVMAIAAGKSLPYYYRTPKQPYRSALAFVDKRDGSGKIVVLSNAATGFRYYLRRSPSSDSTRYVFTRTLEEFDSLTAGNAGGEPQVLTTFSRALRIELPEIENRLATGWQRDTTFAATVGDGEITVWSRRNSTPAK